MGTIITFESSLFTIKSNEVFFIGGSLLLSLFARCSRKKGAVGKSADRFTRLLFVNGYPSRNYFGVRGEKPIDFLIGQGAVNISTHHHSAILNDLLSRFFSALRNHIKHSIEDILRPNSVNFLLHNLKSQPLIICVSMVLHWITCGGKPKMM